ncbi:MAG: YbaB/EbfC family nucleoid-associated protein [Caldilineaceae bacterium]|nr:YbaB/EbfC family nucleoid-associated protein [Caldilineaceae bacterium]
MSKKRGFGGVPGGRGGMPNMGNLMAQVQKLQEEMEKTQAALADEEITVSAGGGAVTLVVTGARAFKSVTIKPEVVDPDDVEMLQDLLLAAINDALQQVKDLEEQRMGGLTGGLGLPPGLI